MKREASIEGFIGRKSSGKSYEALAQAASRKHVIRVDLNRQPDMEKGATLLPNVDTLVHAAKNFDRRKKCHYLWRGQAGMKAEEQLIWAAKFAVAVGGVTILSDETESCLPKPADLHPLLDDIFMRGRHIGGPDAAKPLGVPFMWTAVVDTNVIPMLRNQSDVRTYFKGHDVVYKGRLLNIFERDLVEKLMAAPLYSKLVLDLKTGPRFVPYEGKLI